MSRLLDRVPSLSALVPQPLPVAEAVTKIVVGQMLSRAAADTIYARLVAARLRYELPGCWMLSEVDLLESGLSRRKVRTIRDFGVCYEHDPQRYEAWRELEHTELSGEVSMHWGLSQWSSDMLAIFYFARPDVFPATDGTIIRVRRILEEQHLLRPLKPDLARPYRSYLARFMWALLDGGVLIQRADHETGKIG